MNKVISFFKGSSAITLVIIALLLAGLSYFIEKPLPNIFLALRLFSFVLFVYAVIRLFNKK